MATLEEAFQIALQHHQAGRIDAAEKIYRDILAIEINPHVLHLLGLIFRQQGKHAEAVKSIEHAIRLQPHDFAFHNNLGNILIEQGMLNEAVDCFRRALQIAPEKAETIGNLSICLQKLGRFNEAEATLRESLRHNSQSPLLLHNLGLVLKKQGKIADAVDCYRCALQFDPNFAECHGNLGVALRELGQLEQAIDCYRRALTIKPNHASAWNNLGNALQSQGQSEEALQCFRRALEIKPDYTDAYKNLGIALRDQGDSAAALRVYLQALQIKPDFADVLANLGAIYHEQGNYHQAANCYERALDAEPTHAPAHLNRALFRLLSGDFQNGWPEYEYRWKAGNLVEYIPEYSFPQWNGESLAGKTLLLHAEQGLGDTLQFIRYAAPLRQLGAKLSLLCQKPLAQLLSRCDEFDEIFIKDSEKPLPLLDYYIPLLSLPRIFQTDLNTIPATIPYLRPDPLLVQRWKERLQHYSGFRIAINWHGRESHGPWKARNVPLHFFSALARISGVQLFSLQKGEVSAEESALLKELGVVDFGAELDSAAGAFMDSAAIMQHMHLVISSDTSVPHLAGALGSPVWVALPFAPDWRWQLQRHDSPWYPTMRLFRQAQPQDWQPVFKQIEIALRQQLCS